MNLWKQDFDLFVAFAEFLMGALTELQDLFDVFRLVDFTTRHENNSGYLCID